MSRVILTLVSGPSLASRVKCLLFISKSLYFHSLTSREVPRVSPVPSQTGRHFTHAPNSTNRDSTPRKVLEALRDVPVGARGPAVGKDVGPGRAPGSKGLTRTREARVGGAMGAGGGTGHLGEATAEGSGWSCRYKHPPLSGRAGSLPP